MKTVKGDLVKMAKEGQFDIIIHGCNCFCTMGSGIAKQIAEEFKGPKGPFEADKNFGHMGNRKKLGLFSIGYWSEPREDDDHSYKHWILIFNAYTQYGTAKKSGECVVDYKALTTAFRNIRKFIEKHYSSPKTIKIGYPAIGAGLAGGDWNIISKIIDEELEGLNHTFVEYDGS